ncbi:NADPH-dependent FMN reductase [Xenophilus azovorans]|uniref:NADPH-dependent FMN reductase n=1 Tax=Xenophilus azovorans TaxID=151755 RepID=UPI00056E0112|nr:NAD(P)H-dependent oxidoreductase [Xenophilus azovorans]
MKPRILVFSGSRRAQSFNARLAKLGAAAVDKAGGQPTLISLDDYVLPIYDGDEEQASGIPAAAMALKQLFKTHHGILIASPEYNASISPLLKNVIDWVSRATPTESGKVPYKGKVVALTAATASAFAGSRALTHLRQILSGLGAWVVPDQPGISGAAQAFAEDGSLKDAGQQALLEALAASLVAAAGNIGAVTEPQH